MGARVDHPENAAASSQHRLTNDDLKLLLNRAGAMMVPGMDLAGIRASFAKTSAGVVGFWSDLLSLNLIESAPQTARLADYLRDIDAQYSALVVPLLKTLLVLPRPAHSFLGRVIARHLPRGPDQDEENDALLWQYIAGEISNADALSTLWY